MKILFKKVINSIGFNISYFDKDQLKLEPILKTIDVNAFEDLRHSYYHKASLKWGDLKFLNLNERLLADTKRVCKLGLDKSDAKAILDIGCGPGYFLYICKFYGHDVAGIDLDTYSIYNDLVALLGIKRIVHNVKPFKLLPKCKRKYDLITSFLILFNNVGMANEWGIHEWTFFLKDLARNQLTQDGQVFLRLNRPRRGGSFYANELLAMFIDKGADVNEGEVYFKSMEAFRS